MDRADVDALGDLLIGMMVAGVAVALLLVCRAVRSLREDVDLLRITAAVPASERDT